MYLLDHFVFYAIYRNKKVASTWEVLVNNLILNIPAQNRPFITCKIISIYHITWTKFHVLLL